MNVSGNIDRDSVVRKEDIPWTTSKTSKPINCQDNRLGMKQKALKL
jgi:hypothetical protein